MTDNDLIVRSSCIPVTLTSETRTAADGRTRWQQGGKKTPYAGKQFWWSRHEVGFKDQRVLRRLSGSRTDSAGG
ncbi:MAG: hypothetical protein GY903_01790 [Fuerstiella sp.]|nr:hypothetical protein [Fuerstiella sp.]MCP4853210.1 hypothetical protein [Fuerstiella sp.]